MERPKSLQNSSRLSKAKSKKNIGEDKQGNLNRSGVQNQSAQSNQKPMEINTIPGKEAACHNE